jgi:hypothetical protein
MYTVDKILFRVGRDLNVDGIAVWQLDCFVTLLVAKQTIAIVAARLWGCGVLSITILGLDVGGGLGDQPQTEQDHA